MTDSDFILCLYNVGRMAEVHSDTERGRKEMFYFMHLLLWT